MASDLYSLLMADEPSAAEQAQALAAAIRGQKQLGTLGALTGDRVLGQLGQTLTGDAGRQEQALQEVAGTRLQRALQRQQMAQQQVAQQADEAHRAAQLGLQRQGVDLDRQRLQQDAAFKDAQLNQENWSAQADPVSGGIVMWNKKTGEVRPLGPGGGQPAPAGGGPLPPIPGKVPDSAKKDVLAASANIAKLDMAISSLAKAPGTYGGTGNYVAGLLEQAGGTPMQSLLARRYEPQEQQTKNYISNVVSGIINERAGANVTYREELRQKFLPQDTDSLDVATLKLKNLRDFEAANYQAKGGPGDVNQGSAQAPDQAPPVVKYTRDKSGKLVRQP